MKSDLLVWVKHRRDHFLVPNAIQESFNERLKAFANSKSTNLYVSNLPRDMTEAASQKQLLLAVAVLTYCAQELNSIFFGYEVESSRILRDSHGNSRGVGFARYAAPIEHVLCC